MKERINRINELIRKTIAIILSKEIFLGKDVLATVQKVDTSKDLKYSKIWISVFPFNESGRVLKILEKRKSHIQKELGNFVKIKFLPKIEFKIDETEEKADKIEKILKKIKT